MMKFPINRCVFAVACLLLIGLALSGCSTQVMECPDSFQVVANDGSSLYLSWDPVDDVYFSPFRLSLELSASFVASLSLRFLSLLPIPERHIIPIRRRNRAATTTIRLQLWALMENLLQRFSLQQQFLRSLFLFPHRRSHRYPGWILLPMYSSSQMRT